MPPLIPALAATATAGAVIAGPSVYNTISATNAAKKAANQASDANAAAIKNLQDAQSTASNQAMASVSKRRSQYSQTVYTSPMGLNEQATTAKKLLLGS